MRISRGWLDRRDLFVTSTRRSGSWEWHCQAPAHSSKGSVPTALRRISKESLELRSPTVFGVGQVLRGELQSCNYGNTIQLISLRIRCPDIYIYLVLAFFFLLRERRKLNISGYSNPTKTYSPLRCICSRLSWFSWSYALCIHCRKIPSS